MISIQNVSEQYSKTGLQQYLIRINDHEICCFNHLASDGLAICLVRASVAVAKIEKEKRHE